MLINAFAVALAAAQASGSAPQAPLYLTCLGGGTANKTDVRQGNTHGSFSGMAAGQGFSGSGSSSTTVYGRRQQGFEDQVDIRLFEGDDRIRMPRTMLPAIRGGKEGWFKLKDVSVDARSIRASAAVNFINNPKVYIDRVTGTISISGKAGDFSGQCEAVQADTRPKF